MRRELQYEDLKIGMKVTDSDGDEGIIINTKDMHNVEVDYILGGKGLYCLADECEYNTNKLYKNEDDNYN